MAKRRWEITNFGRPQTIPTAKGNISLFRNSSVTTDDAALVKELEQWPHVQIKLLEPAPIERKRLKQPAAA